MSTGGIIDSQVLVSKTADGVDLGSLWDEFTDLLDVYNNHTTKLCDLLRFPVTIPGSAVPQGISSPDFELSTENGVPQAAGRRSRPPCWATGSTTTTCAARSRGSTCPGPPRRADR